MTQPRIPAPSSASPCCSARWPSPAPAAGRTWCSPTGSGTRASAWARTCRAWSARSPASRRRRRAPATSSSRRGQHAALAGLVEVRQHRAAGHLRPDHVRDDRVHLAAGLLDRLRPRRAWPTASASSRSRGRCSASASAPWFQTCSGSIGAFSLFAAAMGIVDYTSRLAADVIKTSYARDANESRIYAGLVWGLVADRHRRAAGRLRPAARAAGDLRRASAAS